MLTLGSGTWQKTAIFWLHCHARSKRWRETSVGTSFVFENIILLNAFSFIVIICFKPLTWWEEAQHCMCSQTNIAPLLTSSSGKELENDILDTHLPTLHSTSSFYHKRQASSKQKKMIWIYFIHYLKSRFIFSPGKHSSSQRFSVSTRPPNVNSLIVKKMTS